MYCKKCGNLLESTDTFCKKCGQPVDVNNTQQNNQVIQPEQQPMAFQGNAINNPAQPTPVQPEPINSPIAGATNVQPIQPPQSPIETPTVNATPTPVETITPVNMAQQVVQTNPGLQGQGQMVNQTIPNNAPVEEPKKNNFKIIVIILIVIILILGGFIAYKMLSKDKTSDEGTPDISTNTDNETNNTNEQINNSDNTNGTYEYKDFQFTIPETYTATEESNNLTLLSKVNKVSAFMVIHDYITIEDYNEAIESIKASLTSEGFTINSVENKKYEETDWILINCTYTEDGQKYELTETFASLGEYHVMEALVGNFGTQTDESIFTEFSKMYNSATYKGSNKFSSDDEKGTAANSITKPVFDTSIIE